MTAWYRVLPLTASCLSHLPGFKHWPGHMRKLQSLDLGIGSGFRRVLLFPSLLTTG